MTCKPATTYPLAMLKGWTLPDALPELGILSLMLLVFGSIAVMRYRDTVG